MKTQLTPKVWSILLSLCMAPIVCVYASSYQSKSEEPTLGHDDQLLLSLESRLPGFGGLYVDSDESIVVLLAEPEWSRVRPGFKTDTSSDFEDLANLAITEVYTEAIYEIGCRVESGDSAPGRRTLRFRKADFTITELLRVRLAVRNASMRSGVQFLDLDEAANRVVIGAESEEVRQELRRELSKLDIPQQAVVTEIVQEIKPMQLTVRVDPLQGGALIQRQNDTQRFCALGFNAYIENPGSTGPDWIGGYVTNSHCTSNYASVDGTAYVHGNPPVYLGEEIIDPKQKDCFASGSSFFFLKCRFSDSAFVEYDPNTPWELGLIAKTALVNSGSVIIANEAQPYFRVGRKANQLITGTSLSKVGPRSGWTTGTVEKTCADITEFDKSRRRLCQAKVEKNYVGVPDIARGGDSGAPVFKICGQSIGPIVELHGVLWGGLDDGSAYWFSPLAGIESDMGELKVRYGETP